MNNAELAALLNEGADALGGIEASLEAMLELKIETQERAIAGDLVRFAPRAWPWTPVTATQGFLAGRWLRRDGNVYGGAATRAAPRANSPIAGGDDNQAKVYVPSGAPRA